MCVCVCVCVCVHACMGGEHACGVCVSVTFLVNVSGLGVMACCTLRTGTAVGGLIQSRPEETGYPFARVCVCVCVCVSVYVNVSVCSRTRLTSIGPVMNL